MAGKCDRNECGIVCYPNGILNPCKLSVAASCRIYFTLDRSLFIKWDSMNKEQFNHRILPLFSFSQHAERWNEKKQREERKLCERNDCKAEECLILRLGLWRWSTEPNLYACDKTGVNIQVKEFIILCNLSVLFSSFPCHQNQFPSRSFQPLHCLVETHSWSVFSGKTQCLKLFREQVEPSWRWPWVRFSANA